jgi:hypothetical protein
MVEDRGDDPVRNEAQWRKVLANKRVRERILTFFDKKVNEMDLYGWLITSIVVIASTFENFGSCENSSAERFGLGGALAYTDPERREPVRGAAYLSYVDCCFMRNTDSTPFVGFEFKYHKSVGVRRVWYKVNSALPQLLCALSGHPRCIVGSFLGVDGFVATWRKQVCVTNGFPVYDYFIYPPRTPDPTAASGNPASCRMYSLVEACWETPDGRVTGKRGLKKLLRFLYEIAKGSVVPRAESDLSTPSEAMSLGSSDSEAGDDDYQSDSEGLDSPTNSDSCGSSSAMTDECVGSEPRDDDHQCETHGSLTEAEAKKSIVVSNFGVRSISGEIDYFTCFQVPPVADSDEDGVVYRE